MINLLNLEFKKFIYTYYLWIILIVLILSSCISIMTGVFSDPNLLSDSIYSDSMVFLIAGAIYAGLSITSDFNDGFIRHYLITFNQRQYIIFAKYLHFMFGCILLLLLYPMITLLISIVFYHANEPMLLIKNLMFDLLRVMPYYCALFSIFFMISILSKKDGISLGVTIPLSIILVVFTERLLPSIEFLVYSPIIQIQETLQNGFNGTLLPIFIAFLIILATLSISVIKFKHDEF